MKSITALLISLMLISSSVIAQSNSFNTLKNKFSGSRNVFSFHTSGFFANLALKIAGEHEFDKAIKDIQSIRFIVIPKEAFENKGVTLAGFKKVAKKDSFQVLAHVRDHGDDVTLLMQSTSENKDNHYMLLVDDDHEIVVIEVNGYIDIDLILNESKSLAYH